MCRLLGIIGKKEISAKHYFFETEKKFKDYTEKPIGYDGYLHQDGWGIGWYENKKPKIFKEGKDEVKAYDFSKVKKIKSNIILSHVRDASEGPKTTKNSHPFQYKNLIFAHNGFITRSSVIPLLTTKYKKALKGETDSEVFFMLILQEYERTKDIEESISIVLKEIKKYNHRALNFLLTDGKKLYAYRDASQDVSHLHHYYSLNYLKKKDEVVISSEPLTKESWTLMKLGELITIDKNLNLSVKQLNN